MSHSNFNHSSLSNGLSLSKGSSPRVLSSPNFSSSNLSSKLGSNLNSTKLIDRRLSTTPKNIKIDSPVKISDGLRNSIGLGNKGVKVTDVIKTQPLNTNLNKSFDRLVNGNFAKKLDLGKQIDLSKSGDVARRLDLSKKLELDGGWKNRQVGLVHKDYTKKAFGANYCGPKHCPHFCWFPYWSPWVNWCYGNCNPCYYNPCGPWVYWQYPIWQPLPIVSSGTWVDVPLVSTPSADLQLLAVRFVDAGHPEQNMGPRYRVWIRNNSQMPITQPFNVHAMAANSADPVQGMPMAGVRVNSIEPGQTKSLDIRLPMTAESTGRDASGRSIPFSNLHVLVDSDREIAETSENNNGAAIDRAEILPIDPALMAISEKTVAAGQTINLAGEGLGPEAGQVLVNVNGLELQAEIEGWYDLGVRVKLPSLALASPVDAKVVVIRGDKAATNPLEIKLMPSTTTVNSVSDARE